MSNLASRLLTALIGGPILIAALYLLPVTAFFGIAAVAMSIAAWELFAMTHPDDRFGRVLGTVGSLVVFTALVGTAFGAHHPAAVIWTLVLLMPAVLLISLFRPAHIPTAMNRVGALVMGPMYLGPSMAALALVRSHGTNAEGAGLALLALLTAWFSDSGGFFAGKFIGGPKLYPAVSPNKTWAGAVGGAVGSMLAAVLASTVFLKTLPLGPGIAVCVVAGITGQLGDLAESVLKRSAGVKDSGALLPGHGGILDRVDALMFCALVLYASLRAGVLPFATH
jgi:phosphatidate cytidylyltransferase